MKRLTHWGALAGLVLSSTACGDEGGNDAGTLVTATGNASDSDTDTTGGARELSFEADVEPIIAENCVEGCHEPDGLWATLRLDDNPYEALLTGSSLTTQMDFVTPEEPDESYMYHKIAGTYDVPVDEGGPGGATLQMPYDADTNEPTPLPADDIETIRLWIEQGAEP